MAKDKSGFMGVDIGGVEDPKAAPTSLIEQAGAYEGKAAEIEGQITAATYNEIGKTGSTFYQASKYREAADIARTEMERLNAGARGWMGEEAYKSKTAGDTLRPYTGQQMEEVDAKFSALKAAQDQGVFTPEQSRARMAAAMREMIGANPGAVATIRAAFEHYSGSGKWDLEAMDNAFKVVNTENQAHKHAYQQAEKIPAAFRGIQNAKGEVVGAYTTEDLAQAQLTRQGGAWDAYLKYVLHEQNDAALKAYETADKSGKLDSEKRTIVLKNLLDNGVEMAFNIPRIEMSGTLWEGKSADEIVAGMGVYRSRIEQQLAKQFGDMHTAIQRLPEQDKAAMFEKMQKSQDMATKRLDAMTKDRDSYLSTIEFFKRTAGMDAATLESHAKTWDTFVATGFDPREVARMKTEEGRKQIYHQYRNDPSHPLVQAARQYEQLRVAIASRSPSAIGEAVNDMRRQERINSIAQNIVMSGQLPPAGNNPDEVSGIVAAVKLNESRVPAVVKQADLSKEDVNLLRAVSTTLSDDEATVDSMRAALKGGVLKNTDSEEVVKKNVAARMEQWVFGQGGVYYPEKTKAYLQGNKLDVDGTGNVVLSRVSGADWRVQQEAAAQVRKANKLIDLLAESSGQDRTGLAQRFVEQTNALPTFERSVGRARAQAMSELAGDVGAYLRTVPGYANLDDATRTIVQEAVRGFSTFTTQGTGSDVGKPFEINKAKLKGIQENTQIQMLTNAGVPKAFHEAILKDVNGS